MNGLRSAIGFLTILPLAPRDASSSMASARGWFPLVGLLLGVILVGMDILFALLSDDMSLPSRGWSAFLTSPVPTVPVFLWAALLVATLAVLTRALHLDGFMDSCDALLGGFDRERRLAILRDPHVGAFAVIGVVCLLLIKVAAIVGLPPVSVSVKLPILLLFPCLSRWAMLLTMELYPYVRSNGLGMAFFKGGKRRIGWQLIFGFAFTLIVSVALAGELGIVLLAASCAVAWGLGAWATRLLGGVTGDIYGAVNEVTEVVVLMLALLLTAKAAKVPFAFSSPLLETLWGILL